MATYTTNYNLKKPAPEDFYDIADFNGNADIIDGALKTLTDRIETGSYVGTGTSGASNPTMIACGFPIKLLYITADSDEKKITMFPWVEGASFVLTVDVTANSGQGLYDCAVSAGSGGKTVSFYSEAMGGARYQMNASGETYHYFAIG